MMRRMFAPVDMAFERGRVVLVNADGYFSYRVTVWPALRSAVAAERPPRQCEASVCLREDLR
jgi:hypothetical protein